MVMPDHPTPVSIKTHSAQSVPCVIYKKGDNNANNFRFTEKFASENGEVISEGYKLMKMFLSL